MSKARHNKTLIEKYGVQSVIEEVNEYLGQFKYRGQKEFNNMPYIGIAYIPYGDPFRNKMDYKMRKELIYDFETFDLETDTESYIKAKVIEINDDKFVISHYDNHHHDICLMDAKTNDYYITGNVIKQKQR